MQDNYLFDDAFHEAVRLAGAQARIETLQAGVPVFYRESGLDVMEHPGGQKYEIRFIEGAPRHRNYEVIRELDKSVA